MTQSKTYIYGKHALIEAMTSAPKIIEEVFFTHTFDDPELRTSVKKSGISITTLPPNKLPRGVDDGAVHQGVMALISLNILIRPYKEFINNLEVNPNTLLVLLGEIQDPQNVGAIIRSAAAFGVSGVLIPEHNQAPITGAVVKVSAGMIFRLPLVAIGNVNTTVADLKKKGFWIYGLEGESKDDIKNEKFDAPTVFILGNESRGIRLKTRDLCDVLLSIPTNPQCESLNVASSAAVAMYQWSTKHPIVLRLKKSN